MNCYEELTLFRGTEKPKASQFILCSQSKPCKNNGGDHTHTDTHVNRDTRFIKGRNYSK